MICMNLSARSARLANGDGIRERPTVSMQQSSRLKSSVSHPSEANSSSVLISLLFLDGLGDDPGVMLAISTLYGLKSVSKEWEAVESRCSFWHWRIDLTHMSEFQDGPKLPVFLKACTNQETPTWI